MTFACREEHKIVDTSFKLTCNNHLYYCLFIKFTTVIFLFVILLQMHAKAPDAFRQPARERNGEGVYCINYYSCLANKSCQLVLSYLLDLTILSISRGSYKYKQ